MRRTLYCLPSMLFFLFFLGDIMAVPAAAQFKCGSHMLTYSVRSLAGTAGAGVRCVRFTGFPSVIWYGEGHWNGHYYRHIGTAVSATFAVPPRANWSPSKAGDMHGAAANISGNGEYYTGKTEWLQMRPDTTTQTPALIRVGGDWDEEWILQTDGVVKNYKSPALATHTCGPSLEAFDVKSTQDVPGKGIRCVWRAWNIWYGEGEWKGKTYAHVGTGGSPGIGDSPLLAHNGTAADICDLPRYDFCNFADKTLTISPYLPAGGPSFPHVKIEVRGGWAEDWLPR